MPAVLADGRRRVRLLTTRPNDPAAVTAAEAEAGIKAECRILKSDYALGATGSDTINDAVLCADGNAVTYGASNYSGSMTPLRYFSADGSTIDVEGDTVFAALAEKGTTIYVLDSEGWHHETAFAAGQEYDLYEVVTDNPQKPSDRGGYVKRVVPLGVQQAWENKTIAAGA